MGNYFFKLNKIKSLKTHNLYNAHKIFLFFVNLLMVGIIILTNILQKKRKKKTNFFTFLKHIFLKIFSTMIKTL